MYVYIHDILVLQYVSSRRPSDVGSIVTNFSCTLLIIGHTEPKTVYPVVLTLHMLVSSADNSYKGLIPRSDLA